MNNDNNNDKDVIKMSLVDFIKLIISCILVVFLGIYLMFIFAYKEKNEIEIENTRRWLLENNSIEDKIIYENIIQNMILNNEIENTKD